jgi:hypothetical protein
MAEWFSKVADMASAGEAMLNSLDQAASEKIELVKEEGLNRLLTPLAGGGGRENGGRGGSRLAQGEDGLPVTSKELFNFLNSTAEDDDGEEDEGGGGEGSNSGEGEEASTSRTKGSAVAEAGSAAVTTEAEQSKGSRKGNSSSKSRPSSRGAAGSGNPTVPSSSQQQGTDALPTDPDELRRRCEQMVEANGLLTREVTALNDEVTSFAARDRSNRSTLDDTRKALTVAEKKLSKSQAGKREADAAKQEFERKFDRADKQLIELENKLVLCDGEIADLQKSKAMQHREAKEAAAAVNDEVATLRAELDGAANTQAAAAGSLEASLAHGDKQAAEVKQQLAAAQAALEAVKMEGTVQKAAAVAQVEAGSKIKAELGALQAEFAEYKTRATRVLQTKEQVIADLSANGGGGAAGGGASVELIQATREKEAMREELQASAAEIEQLRQDLQAVEEHQEEDLETMEAKLKETEELVGNERKAHRETTAKHTEELKEKAKLIDQANKQRLAAENNSALKQAELERTRTAMAKQSVSSGGASVDAKMRALTDSVLQKQSKIESLASQNMTLTMQLEAKEAERKRAAETRIDIPITMGSSGGDEWLSSDSNPNRMKPIRSMLRKDNPLHEIPSITNAVSFIDVFSIRLGVFLRKHPIARLMMFGYMVLLHLWTMVILFHYSPELHDPHGINPRALADPNMMVLRDSDGLDLEGII